MVTQCDLKIQFVQKIAVNCQIIYSVRNFGHFQGNVQGRRTSTDDQHSLSCKAICLPVGVAVHDLAPITFHSWQCRNIWYTVMAIYRKNMLLHWNLLWNIFVSTHCRSLLHQKLQFPHILIRGRAFSLSTVEIEHLNWRLVSLPKHLCPSVIY